MLHVSRKIIRIKAKAMFAEKTEDPSIKESFVASSGWIQNFMKIHHLSCRLISYLWYLVLILSRASSTNGWMNEELTLRWINEIVGTFALNKRLLAWDSYKAHMTEDVKHRLNN